MLLPGEKFSDYLALYLVLTEFVIWQLLGKIVASLMEEIEKETLGHEFHIPPFI